jgi:membrane protease YdiL (CAAX protease family)
MTNRNQLTECGISEIILSVLIIIVSFVVTMMISVFFPTVKTFEVLWIALIYLPGIIYLYHKKPIEFINDLHKPLLAKYTIFGLGIIVLPILLHYYYSDNNIAPPTAFNALINQNKFTISEIVYLLFTCIIIPISEEILFRYYYYNIVRNRYGVFVGVIISNLLFVGVHFNHPNPLFIVFQGILFTYIYEKSNSIWSSIIVHMFNNSVWSIVTYMAMIR